VIRAVMFAVGAGWSCVVISMQAGAFAQISSRDSGRASSLYTACRQLASALGVAVLATVVGQQAGTQRAGHLPEAPFRSAFVAAAAFAFCASLAALLIRDSDAAETMRRTPARTGTPAAAAQGHSQL
jgi:MFS family permease